MTHVWQHQHGQNVRLNALGGWIGSGFKYQSLYPYDIDKDDFEHANLEQQAHMVEDYYNDRENLQGWDASDDPRRAEGNGYAGAKDKAVHPAAPGANAQAPGPAKLTGRPPVFKFRKMKGSVKEPSARPSASASR